MPIYLISCYAQKAWWCGLVYRATHYAFLISAESEADAETAGYMKLCRIKPSSQGWHNYDVHCCEVSAEQLKGLIRQARSVY